MRGIMFDIGKAKSIWNYIPIILTLSLGYIGGFILTFGVYYLNFFLKTTLKNKVRALFTETWSHHVVLSLTFWLNYSASFLHLISSLSYPHSITLYILD